MVFLESLKLIVHHTSLAVGMAFIFGAGAAFSMPVLRWQVKPLMYFPKKFARLIERIVSSHPHRLRLALFIFLFNGSAIFLYMLTGLVPGLPLAVAFLTGLNVALASLLGRPRISTGEGAPVLSASARICALLTFFLELPCFWYAMALGWTLKTRLPDIFTGTNLSSARERVVAYLVVILPLLGVSALAEAHAVMSSLAGSDKLAQRP